MNYSISGLIVQSEIALPELVPAAASSPADVHIRLGDVPEKLIDPVEEGVLYSVASGTFLLSMPGIARYLARDGCEIIIQPEPGALPEEIRLFLLGSVWAAVLHQRGLLTLHASGVITPLGAVLFAGRSSRGKSALALAMHLRGYTAIADDTIAVAVKSGNPLAYPTFPQLRIWPDTAHHLGLKYADLLPLRPKLLKRAFSTAEKFSTEPQPLKALYVLHTERGQQPYLEAVQGMSRFSVLLSFTFRERFLNGMGTRPAHFEQTAGTARKISIAHLTRPNEPLSFDALINLVEKDLGLPLTSAMG